MGGCGAKSDWVLHGAQESGEELLNSCYLKHSAGDRRGGGAYTARSEHLEIVKKFKPVCSMKATHFIVEWHEMTCKI